MSQERDRVPISEALNRLSQFSQLATVIDKRWLEQQYQLKVENYSLITGWLSTSEFDWTYTYKKYVTALDTAIAMLQANVPTNLWNKLRSKLRAQSTRAQSKGTLAELALSVFLVQNGISFNMEQKLDPASNKDVDFSLQFSGANPVHIEMQWLSESEASERAALVSAQYQVPMSIDFESTEQRIRNKILDKVPKLTKTDITLVALDCTVLPELGGVRTYASISNSLAHIFGTNISGPLTEPTIAIRELVDAVIWFETDFDTMITPVRRGYVLNEHSSFYGHSSLVTWIKWWSAK